MTGEDKVNIVGIICIAIVLTTCIISGTIRDIYYKDEGPEQAQTQPINEANP